MQSDKDSIEVKRSIIALDVGGTFIKSGVWDNSAMRELSPVLVHSHAGRKEIIESFKEVFSYVQEYRNIAGVGICIPGPFQYARGISLMKHKFVSIEGLDLRTEIRKHFTKYRTIPIRFCHDTSAFLSGELACGSVKGYNRVLGITLGTGIGVVAAFDGEIQLNAEGYPTPEISLWNKPFGDGTVEGHISASALIANYCKTRPNYNMLRGVKGIAEEAELGDHEALKIFSQLGRDLNLILSAHARKHLIECIVLGGQVSKAFELFSPTLLDGFDQDVRIYQSSLGDKASLVGTCQMFTQKYTSV